MNRTAAVRFLHKRHPRVVLPPDDDIDPTELHLEMLCLQIHACDLMGRRAARPLRRCFTTVFRLLVEGDPEVREAVPDHFALPHLVFHGAFPWARKRMPAPLDDLCCRMRELIMGSAARRSGAGPPA